jgi:hypothetical protein
VLGKTERISKLIYYEAMELNQGREALNADIVRRGRGIVSIFKY